VMNTIRAFAAEDATVIFGTVRDDSMGDALRVTVGRDRTRTRRLEETVNAVHRRAHRYDNAPLMVNATKEPATGGSDYSHLDTPAVWRSRESASRESLHLKTAAATATTFRRS